MAGDWIKMRADLHTHPKVVRMMSALKADKLRVIGGLHAVWCLFDAHTDDGQLDGYSPEVMDEYLGWNGFSAAMIAIGWLINNGESLSMPEFDEHNGQCAKRRAQETQRKREARKMSAPNTDKKRTREEKRREDIKPASQLGAQFAMHADWIPSDHVADMARQSGAPLIDSDRPEFVAYWLTQPDTRRTQAEWDKSLMQSAKHRRLRADAEPPARQPSTAKPAKFDPVAYVNGDQQATNGGDHGRVIEHA